MLDTFNLILAARMRTWAWRRGAVATMRESSVAAVDDVVTVDSIYFWTRLGWAPCRSAFADAGGFS